MNEAIFTRTDLSTGDCLYWGMLPDGLMPNTQSFETLWQLHPQEHRKIMMHGRLTPIPRWQEAFGRDYEFSGQVAAAQTIPPILKPFLSWAQSEVHPGLNGMLLNWYSGALGHYIGPHHDDDRQLVPGTPIVTISLGDERIFRFLLDAKRDGKKVTADKHDVAATSGSAIIIPWETNLRWKHCVPKRARYRGQRISITLRAFQ